MSGCGALRRVAVVGLLAVPVLGASCSEGGSGRVSAPVPIEARAPRSPLVPGALPEGFQVEGTSMGDAAPDTGVDHALLIGAPDRGTGPSSGPVIVVGESSGSASIAGPRSGDPEPVADLGVVDSFDAYIAEDGPWTWVVFNDDPGCHEDCLDFVAGRGVPDEDLIAVARGTDYQEQGEPVVDADALPDGMVPLLTARPADGILTSSGARISLRSADGTRGITVQQVDADAELASLWGFWIDDEDGTPIRGQSGWAGSVGGTLEGGELGRVWVEDATIVAVVAWDVSDTVVDQVIEGLRRGTPHDLTALGGGAVARVPTPEDAPCGSAVLSGLVEDNRWVVGLDADSGNAADTLEVCTEVVTPSGPVGGTAGTASLGPVGSLTVQVTQVSGGPVAGTFVYGAAPPGTATVELTTSDGAAQPLELSDTGPREHEERWFATFTQARVGDETVIARAADGAELARAPAGS